MTEKTTDLDAAKEQLAWVRSFEIRSAEDHALLYDATHRYLTELVRSQREPDDDNLTDTHPRFANAIIVHWSCEPDVVDQ